MSPVTLAVVSIMKIGGMICALAGRGPLCHVRLLSSFRR